MFALLLLPAAVSADLYVGGIPLSTVESGTVSGGVFIDAYPGLATDATKTFTLPAGATVRWARLYVVVYCGHMENNYEGKATVSIDGGGAGTREYAENLNVPYSFPGEGGTGPVALNDHCTRVTSDYLIWYDATPLLSSGTLKVRARTAKVSPSFDGRIKAFVLVAAYDDGDNDTVHYWVNHGHDTDSYKADAYVGETEFSTNELEEGFESASLSVLYLASADAEYRFNGASLDGGSPVGAYFGKNTWDVGDSLQPGRDAGLTYDRLETETFYKIFGAVLSVRYAEEESGSIAVSSSPAGATVYIDDEESGVTNTTVTGLAVGDHTVRVEKEGYKTPDERTVTVKKGSTTAVSFTLAPLTGSISVVSEPQGAAILLDGIDTGKTTDAVIEHVPVGSHTLTLNLAGYTAYSTTVTVEDGAVAEVRAVLTTGGSSSDGNGGSAGGSGYAGGTLTVARHASIRGNLSITSVSNYTGLLPSGSTSSAVIDPGLPEGAAVREARLYLLSTWAHDEGKRIGSGAEIALSANGTLVQAGARYSDRKGEGPYDYPVETFVYDLTPHVGRGNLTVKAANSGTGRTTFALYGCLLMLAYEMPDAPEREYWIAEGSDAVLAGDAEEMTTMLFSDLPEPSGVAGARFTAVSTAATGEEGEANAVGFNGGEWWNLLQGGSSAISLASVDVLPYLTGGENTATIRSVPEGGKGDYMENRLAVLLLTLSADAGPAASLQAGETAEPGRTTAPTPTVQESESDENGPADGPLAISWFSSLWSWILSLFGIHSTADPGIPVADAIPSEEKPIAAVTTPAPLKPGDIRVSSAPAGALIYLDGTYTGRTTPFTLTSVQPGDHEVRLEHELYSPLVAAIALDGSATVAADLTESTYVVSPGLIETAEAEVDTTGCIYVTSKPDGATIVLDGRTLSYTTPQVICGLKPGIHTVKIKNGNGNFPIDSIKCSVTPGAVTPVSFVQDQVKVRSVTVAPESFRGAEFSVNGMRLNTKVPARVDVAGISSFFSIKNATGYYSFMISDFLDDGAECCPGEPAPATAGVLVRSSPAGAAIFIDGFETGFATPSTIANVSPGRHLISVSRAGYIPQERRILLVDDPNLSDDADLSFVLEGYPYGSLTVASDPPGGKIYLYGKDTGEVTPHTFGYMRIGRYEVKVTGKTGSATRDDIVVLPRRANTYTFTLS
nr:DUF3344 domain-containing protein [Methanofollis tationis]